ncbi:hypothetical protein MFMK1_003563 [Metallumcola ferriviriculae]|uniref:DUF2878 domain-containing protein n=1 Tax=Metallumcola ferriviriculae TaxID=3039180 RepID=A0AAU0US71_9FIRM|nr:hypothetical protein MFMK1_003563 [Desulfitibacteraceae bacterium MK1]
MFQPALVSFYKAVLFGIATILLIPKEKYKKFLIYGFLLGAVGDVLIVTLVGGLLGLIKYQNTGPFNILGLFSFWTPLAWMFTLMLFLYFLPVRIVFYHVYIVGFALFGFMVGLVLQHLGTFQYVGNYIYFAPITFITWFFLSAWLYRRSENIALLNKIK